MKLRPIRMDPAKPETIVQAVEHLYEQLDGRLTVDNKMEERVTLTAADGLVSATQLERKNPGKIVPIGARVIDVLDASGAGLTLTGFRFSPGTRAGHYGITITVASGTIDRAIVELVGG